MSKKMTVFWDVVLHSLVEVYRRFTGACCIHHHHPVMEASSTSETSINFY
jgi:hypothetical protein